LVLCISKMKKIALTQDTNFPFTQFYYFKAVAYFFSYSFEASPSGSFGFFCVCIAINICLIYFLLPETAHLNTQEIDEAFKQHKPKLIRRGVFKID
jgi:hypothetical protein